MLKLTCVTREGKTEVTVNMARVWYMENPDDYSDYPDGTQTVLFFSWELAARLPVRETQEEILDLLGYDHG